ncbi:neuropeptide FF receptor 2-like [Saccoglossus kowalevskii]|uniref:Neuropeptide FF receptor 2-like n=1 Tax=Saccoglossus kowalevskii TaxID=10224 RepID=A0ABM0GMT7_SACKO|nr:PREDICTED: neuropeptide FF receptor 2-like [Saccoglossus kowalevskii]
MAASENATLVPSGLDSYQFWMDVYALDSPKEVVLIFGIIFVLMILCGNVWVIIAVVRQPKLRGSATNIFIVSLSVSDILVGLVTVPQHVAVWGYFSSLHNVVLCKIVGYLQSCSLCGTTLSLICIGADRYRAIVQPLKPRVTVEHAFIGCGIVWAIALLYSIGPLIFMGLNPKYSTIGNNTVIEYKCGVLYDQIDLETYIRLIDLIVFYLIPLVVLVILYSIMITTLWFGKSPTNSSTRSKRKALKMLSFVVVQFMITWAPYHCLQMYYKYSSDIPPIPLLYSTVPLNITFFIFCCNSWINPILYAYFNENFRKEFVRLFPCLYWKTKVSPDTQITSQQSRTYTSSTAPSRTQVSHFSQSAT